MKTHKQSVCRVCHVACPLEIEIEDGVVTAIHGVKGNPVYHGYSCLKGRQSAAIAALPSRLLHSQKRQPDGSHAPIALAQALPEIADKLKAIVAEHGPRSVALLVGTYGYTIFTAHGLGLALMAGIGSPMIFTSVTIDQPGKAIGLAMHGPWLAGTPPVDQWDALLLVGTNPIVSMNGGLGANPARRLHQARQRGMKLVVIDPRLSDCAKQADVFLQGKPGEDGAILAGLIRAMLKAGAVDHDFIAAETEGLAALEAAVEPFTPDYVAARAGIEPADLLAAAAILGAAKRGAVSAGTGPNMSGHGNLVEYFVKVVTTLRGWWVREGDEKANPGVLVEPFPAIAASPGPFPALGGEKMRIRGLVESAAGLPTATLAEEILMPGEGQIKALIVLGGNPMLAWPDQIRTFEAMQALDLLVCIDPHMSETAKLAHYVVAPKLALEVQTTSAHNELFSNFGPGWGYDVPYAHVAPPVLDPPAGSDLLEEWEFFYDVARHMGVELKVKSFSILDPVRAGEMALPLDMKEKPSTEDVWRVVLNGGPIGFDAARQSAEGKIHAREPVIVAPKPEGWTGRMNIGAGPMLAELAAGPIAEPEAADFPLKLISRRLHDVVNSSWHENPAQLRKWRYNPAFINPVDLASLGIETGDVLEIRSRRGMIRGVAEASPEVRPGCVSMSHSWGRNPDEPEDPLANGGNTGRLAATDRGFDAYTGIPIMSAIPVRVSRVEGAV
jgi:anaerobic selenocysteine-containing dehydrogenase